MNSVPLLNSAPLRKLLRKHGNFGYLLVGLYLAGYWLYHHRRREAFGVLTLLVAAGAFTLWPITCYLSHGVTHPDIQTVRPSASYKITDLGVVSGYEYSFAEKVNNRGQVAGEIADEEFEKVHGFFYSGGRMTDIGTLGGEFSIATGLNDSGQVVGTSDVKDEVRGFLWQNGKMNRIGTLGGPFSTATGINNKGEVVGLASTSRGEPHAYIWKEGAIRDISAQCPGRYNGATAINDNSDIAGIFTEDGNSVHSFVLSGKQSRPIPMLGGTFSYPAAISNQAHVVGYATLRGDETVHGYVWQPGGIRDLGTLGGENSIAEGVNNRGDIVGGAETAGGMLRATLWANGKVTDLNTLIPSGSGWQLFMAGGINDKGQITGWGVSGDSVHAFLLTPQD